MIAFRSKKYDSITANHMKTFKTGLEFADIRARLS